MGKRFDVCTPRPKRDGGTWWHRVGSAHQNDKGLIMVYLDSYPMMDTEKGNAVIALFEPKPKDGDKTKSAGGADDDEIPF